MARFNCARTGRRDDSSTLAVVACVVTMGSTNKAGNGIGGDAVDMNSVNNAFLNPMGTFSFVNATNWGGGGPTDISGSLVAHWNVLSMGVGNPSIASGTRKAVIAIQSYNRGSGWPAMLGANNSRYLVKPSSNALPHEQHHSGFQWFPEKSLASGEVIRRRQL
ncbi:hypothetical protein [Yersinia enterocolitica]|uniref:hypothetical protein n=1 Tax=Yersinia enterocolitica TaxID=630 RepID=UPI003D069CCB